MSYKTLSDNVKAGIAIAPVDTQAATVTGVVIDRLGYDSAVFIGMTGVASGSPSATSVVFTVLDCATSGGSFVTTGNTATITADSTGTEISVPLTGENRYIKIQAVVSFTGGTTPAIEVASAYVLGSPKTAPAA